jgi:hypothetical protein
MATNRKLALLLVMSLFLVLFFGGYHHFCEYYSDTCSICSHTDNQSDFFLTRTNSSVDHIQPLPITSYIFLSVEFFPDPAAAFTPLKGRAPPLSS